MACCAFVNVPKCLIGCLCVSKVRCQDFDSALVTLSGSKPTARLVPELLVGPTSRPASQAGCQLEDEDPTASARELIVLQQERCGTGNPFGLAVQPPVCPKKSHLSLIPRLVWLVETEGEVQGWRLDSRSTVGPAGSRTGEQRLMRARRKEAAGVENKRILFVFLNS